MRSSQEDGPDANKLESSILARPSQAISSHETGLSVRTRRLSRDIYAEKLDRILLRSRSTVVRGLFKLSQQ